MPISSLHIICRIVCAQLQVQLNQLQQKAGELHALCIVCVRKEQATHFYHTTMRMEKRLWFNVFAIKKTNRLKLTEQAPTKLMG